MVPTILQGWRGSFQSANIIELFSGYFLCGFYEVFLMNDAK